MKMRVEAGDEVELADRDITVSELAAQCLPLARAYLIGVARAGGQVTYGEMVRDLELTYAPNGMGHLLDVLSVDCLERDEPSLAALVVSADTLEVGYGYGSDPETERPLLYRRWLSRTIEGGGVEQLGPIRGTCPECGSADVTRIQWGMPGPEGPAGSLRPPWLHSGGCVVGQYDAICEECDQRWWATEDGTTADLHSPDALYFYADARGVDDLADWISDATQLDASVRRGPDVPDVLTVHFARSGVDIRFPTTLAEFWQTVHGAHAQALEELEPGDR
ncbi:hypothetical protein GHK92_19335 [Nocardioides sp. dk4132]|uniref:hypothetical protein n=1 Tax=unclassified Nocardioides TaxID=2615069 RepID=UPI001297409E|nr:MULTISPECIES: hypothetical protein [unclassified Nocardioides]MQW78025.1 hypothetical protein [Nocardioides sp. dk4132]QGA08132.1 hypothetical protein GFH29_12515 [Nocardioides sp. dk884]